MSGKFRRTCAHGGVNMSVRPFGSRTLRQSMSMFWRIGKRAQMHAITA